MTYSVRQSFGKIFFYFIFSAASCIGSYYAIKSMYNFDFPISKLSLILYLVLFAIMVISAIIVPFFFVLILKNRGDLIQMDSMHFTAKIPNMGEIKVPWREIERFDVSITGSNKTFLIFLHHPEKYTPALTDFQKKNVQIRENRYHTPFSLITKFLNRPAEEIQAKGNEFLGKFGQ